MKITTFLVLILSLLCGMVAIGDDATQEATKSDTTINKAATQDSLASQIEYKIYYFHGDRRCVTCKNLEAYADEAFRSAFEKEIADSLLVWTPINYDREENEHYIDEYKLYTKALIISRIENGKEIAYKNLDKIWLKVDDKEEYIKYVQSETRKFIDDEIKQDKE